MTMSLVQHIELGTAQATITFSSIPQDATDLVLVVSGRTNRSPQADDQLRLTFNGTASGYSERGLAGNGSSAFTFTGAVSTSIPDALWTTASGATANTFGNSTAYIHNYTSNVAKTVSTDNATANNGSGTSQAFMAGLWTGTAAITSLSLTPLNGSTIAAGSSATLYKVTRGTLAGVTVS